MKIGIHPDTINGLSDYSKVYCQILEINKIEYEIIDVQENYFWERLENISHFIYRYGHYPSQKQIAEMVLPVIETKLRTKIYPDYNTIWHFDNKISQHFLFKASKLPFVESFVFFTKERALEFVENTQYPFVVKLKGGAGSSGVVLIEKPRKARKLVKRLFNTGLRTNEFRPFLLNSYYFTRFRKYMANLRNGHLNNYWQKHKDYFYVQEFLPDNNYDTRVLIIGNRALAFIRHNRKNDFRASGSGAFDLNPNLIDRRMLKIAFDISEKLCFQCMAYDFIIDVNNNPVICEISYTFQNGKPYTDCPGYWDNKLNWHPGKNWPQYYQLVDLLNMPNLKSIPTI